LNLEADDISKMGIVDGYADFTWKSLFDDFSCTECGRCSNFCPAYNTDKPLSPMHLIHDLRAEGVERASLREEIEKLEAQVAATPAAHAPNGHDNGHGGGHADADHHQDADQDQNQNQNLSPAARLAALKAQLEAMPAMIGGRIREETLWACTTCGA